MIKAIEHCPICEWIYLSKTNVCTKTNPIFDCKYKHIPHAHSWCRNGHEWICDSDGKNLLWRGQRKEFNGHSPETVIQQAVPSLRKN